MKAYFAENDLYPATYCFKDEADGTVNGDIGFITSTIETGAIILSDYLSHRKVIYFDNSLDVTGGVYRHTFTSQTETSGTVEWWFNNAMDQDVYVILADPGGVVMCYVRYVSKTSIRIYHAATYTTVTVDADAWVHIRAKFDCGTDKWSCWVDSVLKVDDLTFYLNNIVTYVGRIDIGSADQFELYLDAVGYSWDTDYTIGDNFFSDMHDPYNKTEITNIKIYPTITPRLDAYWMGNIVVRDFEGALFSEWHGRDFNKILIEDDSDNVLFRGFLIRKLFKKDSLTLFLAGLGVLLEWEHFGSEGHISYILAEGLVKVPISSDSILQVKDLEGAAFTWDVDWWIAGGRDVGLLIVDRTTPNTRTWDSSAISQSGGTVRGGNNASTLTYADTDYYAVRESTITPAKPITIITLEIDGVAIDDTDFLKTIQIEFCYKIKITAGILAHNYGTVSLQILKDTTWETISKTTVEVYLGTSSSGWISGIPLDVIGGNGNQIIIRDTNTELQKYFDKTGATYTSLKGLRFITTGDLKTDGYIDVQVDFINVLPGYTTAFDFTPIMEAITDSTATSLTCADVSAWDEMGVVEDDGVKIGQNTRVVLYDVGSQSGLNIARTDNYGNSSITSPIYPNGDGGTVDWDTTGGDHFGELDDANDATYVSTNVNSETEIYTFGDINTRGGYIDEIVVKAKCSRTVHEGHTLYFCYSVDGGVTWSDPQNTSTNIGVGFTWQTLTFSTLELYDMADFQIKMYNSVFIMGGTVYCSELYVVCSISGSSFDKYMARKFKGGYCIEPLRAVCKLEGAHWYEDYINNKIVVIKLADFVDSTVDLTKANYGHDWEYEDDCNQIRSFYVYGKSEDEIFAKAEDKSVSGYISKQLIDETIATVGDAQEIADAQLALLKTKRPSIKISLKGINANLQLGTTVGLTMVRPTVAEADYPIRMIERSKVGTTIKTVIYCGLGESTIEEKLAKYIKENAFRSHRALTDRLISP